MAKSLTKLPQKFRKADLEVRVVKGWKGRHASTTFFDPQGVLWHHTASSDQAGNNPALGICTNGRSDLPGPLCQILVGRNGVLWMVAAGRANHAGIGGPKHRIPEDSGNAYLIGFECENNGIGEKWSRKQLKALRIMFAVTLKFLDAEPYMLFGHKDWTSRKIDPANVNIDAMRKRVKKTMKKLDKYNGYLSRRARNKARRRKR